MTPQAIKEGMQHIDGLRIKDEKDAILTMELLHRLTMNTEYATIKQAEQTKTL